MKLVLANSRSKTYTDFYSRLQAENPGLFDYTLYNDLLFAFDGAAAVPIIVRNLVTGKMLTDYDGVYMKSYITSYELGSTVAICCQALSIPFLDHELATPPSLSKLTAHAKLAAAGVRTPQTYAGASSAIMRAANDLPNSFFPAILKRANADRGVDNFTVASAADVAELLEQQLPKSVWLLQQHIVNDGFYRVTLYANELAFCIFRSLGPRRDGEVRKAHMYKPSGGANASLVAVADMPPEVITACQQAARAMDRQMAGIDCIFDPATRQAYVLEVNNNPQLITTTTFQTERAAAFVESLKKDWHQI